MNLFRLSLLALFVTFFAACGEDDEPTPSCTQADWVGTYTGTIDCDGMSDDVTVTITASGSAAIIITYDTDNLSATYDPLTPSGCTLNKSQADDSSSLSVEASLDGDNFTFEEIITIGSNSAICNITANK